MDPMKQLVLVYDMEHASAPVVYPFSDKIRSNIYEDLSIGFADLAAVQEG